MASRRRPRIAVCAALLLGACGDAEEPSAPSIAGVPPRVAVPRAPAPTPAPAADVEALHSAWRAAADAEDGTADTAADAFVAAGDDALRWLVRAMCGDDWGFREHRLVARFGPRGADVLAECVRSGDASVRRLAMALLRDTSGNWAADERGTAVCRALLDVVRRPPHPDDGDAGSDAFAALQALQNSRPAGRVVAADLAELWATDARHVDALAETIVSLGPDAEAAWPFVWRALLDGRAEAADRRTSAASIVAWLRPGDPRVLDDVRAALATAPPDVRHAVVSLLSVYGDAAADTAPVLAELLATAGDDDVLRDAAKSALLAMPSAARTSWRVLASHASVDALARVVADPAVAAAAAQTASDLSPDELDTVFGASEAAGISPAPTARALAGHPDPAIRRVAVERLSGDDAASLPVLRDRLADDDGGVRVRAAALLAEAGRDDGTVRGVALEACRGDDPDLRRTGARALAALRSDDPDVRRALLAAAADADESVRWTAVGAVVPAGPDDTAAYAALVDALDDPADGVRRAALARLAESRNVPAALRARVAETVTARMLADEFAVATAVPLVLTCDGASALAARLRSAVEAGSDADFWRWSRAVDAICRAGAALRELRPVLVAARERDPTWPEHLDRAIAAVDAETTSDPEAVPPVAAILGAAHSSDAGDDAADGRRRAAILARQLAPRDALQVVEALSGDLAVRDAVVGAAASLRERSPDLVDPALAARLLRGAGGARDWRGLDLAEDVGRDVAAHDPELIADLRLVRDAGRPPSRARAAVALWTFTGRQEEALPALRDVLAHPQRLDPEDEVPWRRIAAALGEMRLGADDVAAVIATLRAATACTPPPRMLSSEESPTAATPLRGAITALPPLLARGGADAARAVPPLRTILQHWRDVPDVCVAIADALAAMGPSARDALPDLRAAAAEWRGSPMGPKLAAAVRALDAAGR